jgi:putative Mg2+ transporter-C (MgtC) family protein
VVSLTWYELLARLALAAALGAVVGFEREVRERQAGLRTHMLVSLGSALFTIVSAYAWTDFTFGAIHGITYDPTRIAAQIVTGVGFLGAGAILHQGTLVRGLTTAASLWIVAAIGMATGAGYWWAAIIATGLVLFALWPLRLAVYPLLLRLRPDEVLLFVELREGEAVGDVIGTLERVGGKVHSVEFEEAPGQQRLLTLEVDLPAGTRDAAIAKLSEVEHVTGARWGR